VRLNQDAWGSLAISVDTAMASAIAPSITVPLSFRLTSFHDWPTGHWATKTKSTAPAAAAAPYRRRVRAAAFQTLLGLSAQHSPTTYRQIVTHEEAA